jgi:two-component system chemotaxis response regulator CheY
MHQICPPSTPAEKKRTRHSETDRTGLCFSPEIQTNADGMFNPAELQVVVKTHKHPPEWHAKSLDLPELAQARAKNLQTLQLIESALGKLAASEQVTANRALIKTEPRAPSNDLPADKIRALIVDDDSFVTSLISAYLLQMGLKKIDIAEDGRRAISMLYDAKPLYNLVLCDWNMPIKSGLDVHNAMRAAERYQDTCFMLVTAVTEAKQIRAAIEEGVDDYVVKPIDPITLNKKIARIFTQVPIISFDAAAG